MSMHRFWNQENGARFEGHPHEPERTSRDASAGHNGGTESPAGDGFACPPRQPARADDPRQLAILREPLGHVYVELLNFARGYCATFTLTVPEKVSLAPAGAQVLADLQPHIRKVEPTSGWPPGRTPGFPAVVYRYEYNPAAIRLLQKFATRLYGWKSPSLPQDLHLWRADGRPWLASLAAEASGVLLLTRTEEHAIARALPGLHLRWDPLAAIAG